MPKQIDVKAAKPQNKHGQGRTRKCPIKQYNFIMLIYNGIASIHLSHISMLSINMGYNEVDLKFDVCFPFGSKRHFELMSIYTSQEQSKIYASN